MSKDTITLSHGSGGKLMQELIQSVFVKSFKNKILTRLDDSAELQLPQKNIAFTTDSYTVKPLFFPGGDIGKLAVCGTVNDLAVKGAKPIALSLSFIIEEGFLLDSLKKIVESIAKTAKDCDVAIVTGDTKVVGKGEADGIFINTSGVGIIHSNMNISSVNVKLGDAIIISGTLADHGISILSSRENLDFKPAIKSDVASIYPLVNKCRAFAKYIHTMRDPTRGGVVSVLNEIAQSSRVGIKIYEDSIPLNRSVRNACDILGLDPLYLANEGKIVLFVNLKKSKQILAQLKRHPQGRRARIIGEVVSKEPIVYLETGLGSKRILPLSEGEILPRIC